MDFPVWLALVTLFLAGGLTPGPAVMLVTTSSMRYGFGPAMMPALGICAANLIGGVRGLRDVDAMTNGGRFRRDITLVGGP